MLESGTSMSLRVRRSNVWSISPQSRYAFFPFGSPHPQSFNLKMFVMKLFYVDILVCLLFWANDMKFGTSIVILRSGNVDYYCDKFGHGSSFIRNLILLVIWANWKFCEIVSLGWNSPLKFVGNLHNSMNDYNDVSMNTFNAWTEGTGVCGDSMFCSRKHESIITISWLIS